MCSAAEVIGETEVKEGAPPQNQLQALYYFPTAVYTVNRPEYLELTKKVTTEYLNKAKNGKKLDPIYPVIMTENFFADQRMLEFSMFVGQTAWNILESQGYNMVNKTTYFSEMWCQQHYKHSAMEQHVHGFGSQIVGFYFIDCPPDSSHIVFHDPKAAKVMINIDELIPANATYASNMINFKPEPGTFMFTNAWLAHSFTRHASAKPMRFIHFNLGVQLANVAPPATPVEVV
jgi:uncharacterized protein (TIGR02466 family)